MARPRLRIDYDAVRRLRRTGWGSRRIARQLKVSRSLVQRIISGDRPEFGPAPSSRARRETTVRSEPDRHAHALLASGRGNATDEEFADATRRLDELLDSMPASSADVLAYDVRRELYEVVRTREDGERAARDARDRWKTDATRDLGIRWDEESRLAARDVEGLDDDERSKFADVLSEEKTRAETLLFRRLKEKKTGTNTDRLVDRLVANGLKRARRSVRGMR